MAVLIRLCGNIDAAEQAVQDAFAEAIQRWPPVGLPPSPAGWMREGTRVPSRTDQPTRLFNRVRAPTSLRAGSARFPR